MSHKNIPDIVPICFCQKFQNYTKDKSSVCGYCKTKNDPFVKHTKTNFGNERRHVITEKFVI